MPERSSPSGPGAFDRDLAALWLRAGLGLVFVNTDPASPREVGRFEHVSAKDPVVAQDGIAYVTLAADFTRPPPATQERPLRRGP